jgi:predicted oxidoreductase
MIHVCLENKITTFDHADIYGSYTTEGACKAFASGSLRISKCGIQMLAENRDNKIKHYDYSKSHIIWSVEQSLKTDF